MTSRIVFIYPMSRSVEKSTSMKPNRKVKKILEVTCDCGLIHKIELSDKEHRALSNDLKEALEAFEKFRRKHSKSISDEEG